MALHLRNGAGAGRRITSSGIITGVLGDSGTPFVFANNAMRFVLRFPQVFPEEHIVMTLMSDAIVMTAKLRKIKYKLAVHLIECLYSGQSRSLSALTSSDLLFILVNTYILYEYSCV